MCKAAHAVGVASAAFNGKDIWNEVGERTYRGHVPFDSVFIDSFLEPEPCDVFSRHVCCPPCRFVNNNARWPTAELQPRGCQHSVPGGLAFESTAAHTNSTGFT